MVNPNKYIADGLKVSAQLMESGNLHEALNVCKELLKINPYHRKVQNCIRKIEKKIAEKNATLVSADIAATMHLWKEERFDELLTIYSKLFQFAPHHRKLRKLFEKLQKKLTTQQITQRADFISKALAAIRELTAEHRYGDSIQACNELLSIDPLNLEAQKYLKQAKTQLIEQKLKEGERIIESTEFERVLEFLTGLLAIDPENEKVKRLASQTKEHIAQREMLASRIHLNESIARLKQLFSDAEYEKVLQASDEIERLEAGNFTARVYRKKALRAIEKEIDRAVIEKLENAWAQLAPSYQQNPAGFITV